MKGRGGAVLLGAVVVVIVSALVAAVTVLDSPAEERRQRLDHQRSQDLNEMVHAVEEHWAAEAALPADLEALTRWERRDEPRTDPVTHEPYRYRPTGAQTFELCATFQTEQSDGDDGGRPWRARSRLWNHPAGEHCVELKARDDGA